jgi:hypothetical protein
MHTVFQPLGTDLRILTCTYHIALIYMPGMSALVWGVFCGSSRFATASSSGGPVQPPKRGHPSASGVNSSTPAGDNRSHRPHEKIKTLKCVFQCSNEDPELHRASSQSMGERLMNIKINTRDEKVQVALANINKPLDCAALDLMYHRDCLREHERKIDWETRKDSPGNIGQFIADIDTLMKLPPLCPWEESSP